MVFFVWTNDGGPIQYVGLVIFLLQVGPNILHFIPPSWQTAEVASLLGGIAAGAVAVAIYKRGRLFGSNTENVNNNNNNQQEPQQWRQHYDNARTQFGVFRQELQQHLQHQTGYAWTTGQVSAFLGAVAGGSVVLLCLHYRRILPELYQVITLASMATALLRQHDYDGHEAQQQRLERVRQIKRQALDAVMQKLPKEPFVTNESLEDSQQVSIAQLKQMLLLRQTTPEQLQSFLDRQSLVDVLREKRKYSDTCCICFETYTQGDTLRVLPKCGHELHDTCLDQWVDTFVTNPTKIRHDPSCPLCKESLMIS